MKKRKKEDEHRSMEDLRSQIKGKCTVKLGNFEILWTVEEIEKERGGE